LYLAGAVAGSLLLRPVAGSLHRGLVVGSQVAEGKGVEGKGAGLGRR
jgi:hypothetical protein